MPDPNLSAKVALVTGGASGIGAALARGLVRDGVEVVLADRQVELAREVATTLRAGGGRATAVELDVRDLDAFERVVDDVVARTGRVDYLFNNAGIGVAGEMEGYGPDDWDDVIDVNLRGVAHGIQAVYRQMIGQRSGHIVNTASMAGLVPAAGEGSYTATKHAVVGLSKALRIEARQHGVRVSVLCPGVVRTPILSGGKYGRLNVEGLTEDKLLAIWGPMRPMDVDAFATRALRAIARNEAVIIHPRWWRVFWYVERLSPRLSMALWGALLERLKSQIVAAGGVPKRHVD